MGKGESQTSVTPHGGTRRPAPPPRAASCRPHDAQRLLTGARAVGVGNGLPRPHPPRQRKMADGLGRKLQGGAVGEDRVSKPQLPPLGTRCPPPRTPSCRLHSAQRHLARASAVGLVTGPHTRSPRAQRKRATGTGGTHQGRAVGEGRGPDPEPPHERTRGPPPGAIYCPQIAQRQLAGACAVRLVRSPHAGPPAPKERGQGAPVARPKDGRLREQECPSPDTPQHHRETGRETQGLSLPPPPPKPTTSRVRELSRKLQPAALRQLSTPQVTTVNS